MKAKASALRPIIEKVYVARTHEDAITTLVQSLEHPNCPIRDNERRLMIAKARMCPTLIGLQKYLTNSWFRYENMSVARRPYF